MAKKRNIGTEILEGIRQIKRGEHGRVMTLQPSVNGPPVAGAIREIARVSLRTLQDWEHGRRSPSGAARTLLLIAAKNPQVLLDVA